MSKDSENQKTLLGFILGAAAGVAVGMLMAPFAGEEGRRKLTDKAKSLKNQINDTLDQVKDASLAALDKSKKNVPVETKPTADKSKRNVPVETKPTADKAVKKKAKKTKKNNSKGEQAPE